MNLKEILIEVPKYGFSVSLDDIDHTYFRKLLRSVHDTGWFNLYYDSSYKKIHFDTYEFSGIEHMWSYTFSIDQIDEVEELIEAIFNDCSYYDDIPSIFFCDDLGSNYDDKDRYRNKKKLEIKLPVLT